MTIVSKTTELATRIGLQFKSIAEAKTPQVIVYSATPTVNWDDAANRTITLAGNITNLTLQNVPNGGSGIIEVRQNGTGGYGIAAISHAGLTIVYQTGQIPTAANINSGANETTLIGYYRSGDNLQISFPTKETGTVTLPPQTITFSSTPVQDVEDGKDAIITLTGAVTAYTLENVESGDEGRIEVTQNATGGYNLANVLHSGLTTWYKDGKEPDGTNMNVAANGKTIIFYKRFGSTLAVDVQKYEEGAPEPVSGLIHVWNNDEGSGGTVTDSVGSINGTDVGTVTHGTTPDCRIYNGTNAGSSFALPSSVFDAGMTKDFTVSVRFSLEAPTANKPIFLAVVDANNYLYLVVGDVDRTILAQINYGVGNSKAKKSPVIPLSTFHHAVIVHTASSHDFKFYIDTIEILVTTTAILPTGIATNMRVAYADLASSFANMKCGKVQILNKACTPGEVATL